jgi:hypothetical protein
MVGLRELDRYVSLRGLIWSFPVVFLFHDTEEILTVERFVRDHRKRLPKPLADRAQVTTEQFAVATMALSVGRLATRGK